MAPAGRSAPPAPWASGHLSTGARKPRPVASRRSYNHKCKADGALRNQPVADSRARVLITVARTAREARAGMLAEICRGRGHRRLGTFCPVPPDAYPLPTESVPRYARGAKNNAARADHNRWPCKRLRLDAHRTAGRSRCDQDTPWPPETAQAGSSFLNADRRPARKAGVP